MYRLDEAEEAIRQAETLRACREQVSMLRGWLALIRGRPREAIMQMEKVRTETVAARAILAVAYAGFSDILWANPIRAG